MANDNDTVLVPVPRRYLEVVYRALADAMSQDNASTVSSHPLPSTPSSTLDPYATWTKNEIRQLRKTVLTSTARALLDLTAERRGDWVTLSELVEKAGRPSDAVRAALGGFTQLCRRQFHKPHGSIGQYSWPVRVEWKGQNASVTETRYRMLPEIAQWWLEAPR